MGEIQRGALPGAADSYDELILVDTITVLVALQLKSVVFSEAHHVIRGDATLLNVLARGIDAGVRGLRKTRLERKQRSRVHDWLRKEARVFYISRIQLYAPHQGDDMSA